MVGPRVRTQVQDHPQRSPFYFLILRCTDRCWWIEAYLVLSVEVCHLDALLNPSDGNSEFDLGSTILSDVSRGSHCGWNTGKSMKTLLELSSMPTSLETHVPASLRSCCEVLLVLVSL